MPTPFPHGPAVIIKWPNRRAYKWTITASVALVVVALFLGWVSWFISDPDALILAAGVLLPAIITSSMAIYFHLQRRHWRRILAEPTPAKHRPPDECSTPSDTETADEAASTRLAIVTTAVIGLCKGYYRSTQDHGLFWRRPPLRYSIALFEQQFTERGLPIPRYIIDRRFSSAIQSIEMTEHLLDPEFVTAQGAPRNSLRYWGDKFNLYVAIFIAFPVILGTIFQIYLGWPLPTVIALALLAWWLVRSSGGAARLHPKSIIGVGAISAEGLEATLSARDSLTLVFRFREDLLVSIIATDDKFCSFQFTSAHDPGFIQFWQHWNHPHPRPELLVKEIAHAKED